MAKRKIDRPRNGGKWTEARYWQQVRSFLRQAFQYWAPIQECRKAARVGRGLYQCQACRAVTDGKNVQVDHIEPVGSLRCLEDLPAWLERLTPEEASAFQLICKDCHQRKTNAAREAKK